MLYTQIPLHFHWPFEGFFRVGGPALGEYLLVNTFMDFTAGSTHRPPFVGRREGDLLASHRQSTVHLKCICRPYMCFDPRSMDRREGSVVGCTFIAIWADFHSAVEHGHHWIWIKLSKDTRCSHVVCWMPRQERQNEIQKRDNGFKFIGWMRVNGLRQRSAYRSASPSRWSDEWFS